MVEAPYGRRQAERHAHPPAPRRDRGAARHLLHRLERPGPQPYGRGGDHQGVARIREAGYTFDVAYTSVLKRAVRTTWLLLQQLDKIHLPVWKHWRLNERCYGALTAEPVDDLQRKYGDGEVASWRRSWEHRPPAFPPGHPQNPTTDVRYDRWQDRKGKIRPVQLPDGETMGEVHRPREACMEARDPRRFA